MPIGGGDGIRHFTTYKQEYHKPLGGVSLKRLFLCTLSMARNFAIIRPTQG